MLNLKLRINLNIDKWIFSGGGVENNTLMSDIKQLLSGDVVTTTLNYKMNPFFIESSAFAYIAVRTLKKLPSSFPSTTGCIKVQHLEVYIFQTNYLRYTFLFSQLLSVHYLKKMIR